MALWSQKGWKEPWNKDSWVPENFGLVAQFFQTPLVQPQAKALTSCRPDSKKTGREPEAWSWGWGLGAERRKKGEGLQAQAPGAPARALGLRHPQQEEVLTLLASRAATPEKAKPGTSLAPWQSWEKGPWNGG